jgi:S1-C subfamily serine protease
MDQQTLVAAGVDPATAAEVMRRQSRLEMQRLQLRDQASREGWLNSGRYTEALRKLNGDAGALRAEIGEDAYDRFLYLTGQPNRVVVASVIDESPAQMAGIQAGDLVLDYADRRVFAYTDLSNATQAGERGEYVLVRIQRGGDLLELAVPRGPLGIRLDQDQIDPDADWRGLMPE